MFYRMPDESILDARGRMLYFSPKRFINDICNGNRCFICGARPTDKPFNDEHILPDWILSRYDLYGKWIVLPSGQARMYGSYKIPCCRECNSAMARTFEDRISVLIDQGFDAVVQHVETHGPQLIFSWLCLIFVKTHLKDREFRIHQDRRKGDEKITSWYDWEKLHHIHCIARSFYSGCDIEQAVYGSLFFLQLDGGWKDAPFDFKDLYNAQAMLLRLGNIAIIAVLSDGRAAEKILGHNLSCLPVPLLPIDLRDYLALCADLNVRLSEPPQFISDFRNSERRYVMTAHVPQVPKLYPCDSAAFTALLNACRQET